MDQSNVPVKIAFLCLTTVLSCCVLNPVNAEEPVTLTVDKILEKPENRLDSGTARVRLRITDGPHAGKTFTYKHHLWGNPYYDPGFHEGATFVGSITVKNGSLQRLELGQKRKHYTLIILFLTLTLVLLGLAGWEGLMGLLCSLVTLAVIVYAFFPVALSGAGILLSGITLCVLTVLVTVPLVLKGTSPTVPALGGLLLTTGLLFVLTQWGMHYLQLNPSQARHSRLILTHLNRVIPDGASALPSILITGIVLGTLGAMMDVAVVISSTVHEITRDSTTHSFRDAFQSGMTVGREILSTMINTLIFAYVGILLPVLLAFHVFDLSWVQFLNFSFVGIEILRICIGLMGLSIVIPTTALFSASWSTWRES